MKNIFITLVLGFFLHSFLHSQQKLDSLKSLLYSSEDYQVHDLILNQIAEEWLNYNLDSCKSYTQKAIELALKQNDNKQLSNSYDNLGKIAFFKNNHIEAKKWYNKSLELRIENSDSLGIGKSYSNIAILFLQSGNYEKAIEYQKNALDIFIKYNDDKQLAKTYNNLGLSYLNLGGFQKADYYYQKALKIKKKLKDLRGEGISLNQLGNVHLYWGKFNISYQYYYEALQIFESLNYKRGISSCLTNMGIINEELKQFSKAIKQYKKALSFERKINNQIGIANVLSNMGNVYIQKNMLDSAKMYFDDALSIRKKENDQLGIATSLFNLGHVYEIKKDHNLSLNYLMQSLEINERIKNQSGVCMNYNSIGSNYHELKDFDKAIDYFIRSLNLSIELKLTDQIKSNYQELSEVYAEKKNYKKAYLYHIKYKETYDSIFSKESNNQINELQIQYETEKKQRHIKELQVEQVETDLELSKRQSRIRNQQIYFITGLIILIVFFIFFYLYKRNKETSKRNILENNLNKAMFQSLTRQMNPHFIFNALNSIQHYMLKNDEITSNRFLTKFASLVRMILNNSQHQIISLQEEIESIKLYMELESMRVQDKFDFEIKIDEKLNTERFHVPSMIIQPFVENAIWHGLVHKNDKGFLLIEYKMIDDYIKCIIEDNGVGREKALEIKSNKKKTHKSLGISITKSRLKIINKLYNKELKLDFIDLKDELQNPKGTRVELSIPLITTKL